MAAKYTMFSIVLSFSCFVAIACSKLESCEENLEKSSRSSKYRSWKQFSSVKAREICSAGYKCGFQLYDTLTGLPSQPFIKYCECPKNSYCVKTAENLNRQFFYYKCKEDLEDEDETMPIFFINRESLIPGVSVHDLQGSRIPKAKHLMADFPDLETNTSQRSRVRKEHTEDIFSDGETSRETTTNNNSCEECGKFSESVSDSTIVKSEQTEEDIVAETEFDASTDHNAKNDFHKTEIISTESQGLYQISDSRVDLNLSDSRAEL